MSEGGNKPIKTLEILYKTKQKRSHSYMYNIRVHTAPKELEHLHYGRLRSTEYGLYLHVVSKNKFVEHKSIKKLYLYHNTMRV